MARNRTELIHLLTKADTRSTDEILDAVRTSPVLAALNPPSSACEGCGRELFPSTESIHRDWCSALRGRGERHHDR